MDRPFDFDRAERDWLTGTDAASAETMLEVVSRFLDSPRKRRLFGVATCRAAWPDPPAVCRDVVDVVERLADGEATEAEHKDARRRAEEGYEDTSSSPPWIPAELQYGFDSGDPMDAIFIPFRLARIPTDNLVLTGDALHPFEHAAHTVPLFDWRSVTERFREVFGNPFRRSRFDAAWLTSTVVALSAQMYATRNFSAMPILADALQDAGCDDEDLLAHCRGSGPHVRGCWVVDSVLGKG